jgi:hypothetical protein
MTAGDFILHCMKKPQAELVAALPRAEQIAADNGLPVEWVRSYLQREIDHGGRR